MEGTNFIEDLFTRIQAMESENKLLEKELDSLKKHLDDLETKELVQDLTDESLIIQEIKNRNDQQHSKVEKRSDFDLSNKLEKVCISYLPFDNYSQLRISGDFTNWEKVEMKKQDELFLYEVELLKGYQYAYLFHYVEEILIDFTTDYIETNSGMMNNIISIPDENSQTLKKFNKEDLEVLKKAKEQYHHVDIKDGEEYEIFDKIIHFSNFLDEHYEKLNQLKNDKISKIRSIYDEKLSKLRELAKFRTSEINQAFIDRILGTSDNSYLILKEISLENSIIKGIRLYDKNGIICDYEYYKKSMDFISVPLESFFNHSTLYSQKESQEILESFLQDKKNNLKIYCYLIKENSSDSNDVSLIPYKVFPENVDINSYHLEISDNKIVRVKNRETGIFINFESHLIESGNKIGLISSSSLKIYTSLYNKDIVNIIHIHLNDTSDSIAVDNVFLEKNEKPEDYKSFGLDALERKLNYKFLFKDFKLFKIYYNVSDEFIDEPSFEEVRINSESIVKIIRHDLYYNYFAKIRTIPLGMLARKDKNKEDLVERMRSQDIKMDGWCSERYLEELPGFVDLYIQFTPDCMVIEKPIKISLPVCSMVPLTPKEQIKFDKSLLKAEMNKIQIQSQKLDDVFVLFKDLDRMSQEDPSLKSLSLEECKKLLSEIEKDFSEFKKYLEDTQNREVFKEYNLEISIY